MVDIVSYRATIGLFYNKISMICSRKVRKVSVCLVILFVIPNKTQISNLAANGE
jgi:hypothetical protein